MAINKRYKIRTGANAPQQAMVEVIYFHPESEYYHLEEWKEVTDWMVPNIRPGCYFISNYGRISTTITSPSYPQGGIMNPSINQKGYYQINLQLIPDSITGKRRKACCKVHRLVMLAFRYIPGCQEMEVDHIDQVKHNNNVWNLQWATPRMNVQNAIKRGYKEVSLESTGGRFVTDIEAQNMFNELVNDPLYIEEIAEKYNVTVGYCKGLLRGAIRPYYKREYLKKLEQEQQRNKYEIYISSKQ